MRAPVSRRPLTESCCDWLFPGAVEIPSYLVGCFAMDRIGRKRTCAPALLLAGVACMLIIAVPAVRTVFMLKKNKVWYSYGLSHDNLVIHAYYYSKVIKPLAPIFSRPTNKNPKYVANTYSEGIRHTDHSAMFSAVELFISSVHQLIRHYSFSLLQSSVGPAHSSLDSLRR